MIAEQRELLARLRAVVEAKDAENAMLRAELAAALDLRVPKTYATRRYSWMTPPARSCRRTRK